MTVAVAVAKDDQIIMAADSLVNFGGQRFTPDNARFRKIERVGDSLLVWAGWSLYGELLNSHLASKPPPATLDTETKVFCFFIDFWRSIRASYTWHRHQILTDDNPFGGLDSIFLLANRHGIFRIADDMDVSKFEQYCAIGSGSKYALGALRILYRAFDDPVRIAREAVGVGIECDVYCGGEIDIAAVEMNGHSPPPARIPTPGRPGAHADWRRGPPAFRERRHDQFHGDRD